MRLTYDRECDAAYLYLQEIAPGGVARTIQTVAAGLLNLDFDATGRLVGIEAIPASALLPAELLNGARPGGAFLL